ncbi:hypothetical protein Q5H93_10565 [Hymenobacter sp. ASUV-10]|uniref:Uncharacterized protein n=1 Tax=Hymenobacter aranciens TaxID=3063996 RepID=A0ABT9BA83_9BACT|nr:hypothetical protein [Hymenobacter sp. ASUV-10]MDO7875175.1 hypothetical protein [Hymenobacter sp. ASUV-10]
MRLILLSIALLCSQLSRGQAAQPAADVLLLVNGDEIPGQVLAVSSSSISYRPPGRPDTLRLATDAVFLIRFANGTREVLHPQWPAQPGPTAPPGPDSLAGLSSAQRRTLGLRDARRCYTSRSSFWISAGAALQGGPLLGFIAPAVITAHPVPDARLRAPSPTRLADPSYRTAYQQQARHTRRDRAWGGYALGTAAWLLLISLAFNTQ